MNFKCVIKGEILNHLKLQLSDSDFQKLQNKQFHLGVFKEPYLSLMLDGIKTIESRFSQKKIAPYLQIQKDDIVFVKKSSGNVVAYFKIKDVLFFDLKQTKIENIKNQYEKELCVTEEFWIDKKNSQFATLLVIDQIYLLKPFPITKKGMQTWIIL